MTETEATQPLVLYVDDEAANRIVFDRTFGDSFRVALASSAEEALEKMTLETPAVVVSDQRMPGMQGNELLALVKERYPDTVRVILTAYSDPGPMLEAINRIGAARYLVKPWSRGEMAAVLAGAIDAYRLQQQNRALQLQLIEAQRFSMLGTIAANVAHDMNSPLSAIVSNLERLQVHARTFAEAHNRRSCGAGEGWSDAEVEAAEELPEIAREVHESAAYLAELVAGMRAQARVDDQAGHADPRASMIFAVSMARGALIEKGGSIDFDPPSLPRVRLPSTQLLQVLVNVLVNAAQALDRSLPERRVALEARERDGGVEFVITDTGRGMTAEQRARAGRERFTTKPEGQGTGLGLTICREIVRRADGRFEIESTAGQGTRIAIWLPRCGA